MKTKDATLRQSAKILSLFEDTSLDQVQAILGSGLMADLRDGNIAEVKRDEFRRLLGLNPLTEPLLDWLGTVTVPAEIQRFIVRDRIDEIKKSGGRIYTGSHFEGWFFGKTVEPIGETQLRYGKLLRAEVDGPIIAELGGEIKAETTLAEIFGLIEMQKKGEKGALLINGYANIFFVRDIDSALRIVRANWHDGGWDLDANSVGHPFRWSWLQQVFSHNS